MALPAFSFLTSAYRTERYLPATIESVLAQTRSDWELIVTDNGMNDEIAKIVRSYDDPRITLVRQENKGIAGGIDAAAERATGRYYAVVHSDDMLTPEFCERTGAVLDAHPEIDVVGIDAYLFRDEDGQNQVRGYRAGYAGIQHRADPGHRVELEEMIGGEVLYYTAATRAEAWERVGGYACDTPLVPDLAQFIRLVSAGCDVRVLDERLARYRVRTDSTSRDPESTEAFEADLERCFVQGATLADSAEMRRALDVTLRRIRFNEAMRRARWALLAGDATSAQAQAREAYRQRPSLRPAAVVAGLRIAPGMMLKMHPIKQRVSHVLAALARFVRKPGARAARR